LFYSEKNSSLIQLIQRLLVKKKSMLAAGEIAAVPELNWS
jgi:hypothetical protein